MGKIANYNIVNPKGDDKIIISETSGSVKDATKNITVDGIANYSNSKLPSSLSIPVPELYQLKKAEEAASNWGNVPRIGIKGLLGSNRDWVLNNPSSRLFLQVYSSQGRNTEIGGLNRKGGWTHPPHLNGAYTQSRFGDTNWGRGEIQVRSKDPINDYFTVHPIVTEWDIQNDLVLAKDGSVVNFSDPSLYDTAYIQVPMNNLQFLVDRFTPSFTTSTEITEIPFPNGLEISNALPATIDIYPILGVKTKQASPQWNTDSPGFGSAIQMMKIVFRMVIGIENPDFTLTNHTIPYIFGQPSNPMTLAYGRKPTDPNYIRQVILTPGHSTNIGRKSSVF